MVQLYCPQCDAPVPEGATRCSQCPALFTGHSGWRPVEKVSMRERLQRWRRSPSIVLPTSGDILRISLISAVGGVAFGLLFFVAFFFVVASIHGVMGTAPFPAHIHDFMMTIAFKVLRLPQHQRLIPASYFWGAVAAAITFAVLTFRAGRRRAKVRRSD